jgi:hypothetical protein
MGAALQRESGQRTVIAAVVVCLLVLSGHMAARGKDYRLSFWPGGLQNGTATAAAIPMKNATTATPLAASPRPQPTTRPTTDAPAATDLLVVPAVRFPRLFDVRDRQEAFVRVSALVQGKEASRIKAQHKSACAAGASDASRNLLSVAVVLVSSQTVNVEGPDWIRLWFATTSDAGGAQRSCRGGDVVIVSVASDRARPLADIVLDHGDGLYEAQVFVRRPGAYQVCADTVLSYNVGAGDQAAARRRHLKSTPKWASSALGNVVDLSEVTQFPKGADFCNTQDVDAWSRARCVTVDVRMPAAAVEEAERQLRQQRAASRCTHADTFRQGEWRRVDKCDGSVCSGDLEALQTAKGWVWASDWCTLEIMAPAAAWAAAANKWIVAWGDSTLKQPVANFLEYDLRVPVFTAFMENLEGIKIKKRPGFFTYRQYHVTRLKPPLGAGTPPETTALATQQQTQPQGDSPTTPFVSLSYAWGGCPAIGAAPACKNAMGMRNRVGVQRFIESGAGADATLGHPLGVPDMVLLNHFIWRYPLYNESQFIADLHDTVRWMHGKLAERVAATPSSRMPLIVWMTGTKRIHNNGTRSIRCASEDTELFERHLAWVIERELSSSYPFSADRATWQRTPTVLIMSRFELTHPFHYGDEFGHFGVHYGSTRGMCLTGISHKQAYQLSRCLRRTFVDGMVIQWWLNAMKVLLQ